MLSRYVASGPRFELETCRIRGSTVRSADHEFNMYLLTYLLMDLSPSGEAANSAATQEFPSIYGTRRFITVFTRALHRSLS
jgi:hypothetical protein